MNITIRNNDILEVRLSGLLANQVWINTFHYAISGLSTGTAQPTGAELATAFEAKIWDGAAGVGLRNMMSDAVTDVSLTYQVVWPLRSLALPTLPANTDGAVSATPTPPTTAVVIKRRSIIPGRKNRGRVFVPGLPGSWTFAGEVAGGNRAAVVTASSALATIATVNSAIGGSANATPYIFSNKAPVNKLPVMDTPVDFILRCQRRREVGRGI